MSCPFQGLCEFGGVATGQGKGLERRRGCVEKFESFSDNVPAGEARGSEDYEVVKRTTTAVFIPLHCSDLSRVSFGVNF